ncbi:MAG TPA: HAMP domain-containing sensor histidine kinase [Acidimicrobiia bacterium]|jgi:signal transduction histidine kinase|nr:HAMP domain-containing sensor histidine kinase [Acidimicrobiia bacterium]
MPDWLVLALPVAAVVTVAVSAFFVVRANLRQRRAVAAAEEAHSIKNDFVAMVSHELRTPLTSIAGFADALLFDWRNLPDSEVDEFLSYIHKQALYLGDLVEDVLVIPRLEAGRLRFRPEVFDLGKVVHEVTEVLVASGERNAVVSMPTGVMVDADPKRVQQVVRNLMENARKYGGEQVLVEGFGYGDHYVVVVADNGPGVPDTSIEQIFEHFEQLSKGDARSSSGIGLGLPIARRLARAMGGDVWYERRFPTGSRFCFSLPLQPGEKSADGSVAPVPESVEPRRPAGLGVSAE